MALVLSALDYNLISNCDTATWSLGDVDAIVQVEGDGCLGEQVKNTTGAVFTIAPTDGDFTGLHLSVWMMCQGLTDTKENGGFRTVLDDGTNVGTWFNGGGFGNLGWNCFVIDPAGPPTLWNGSANTGNNTLDESTIATVGVQFKTITSAVGTLNNCFWDYAFACSGFSLMSGATDQITTDDIAAASTATAYGCAIKEKSGSFLFQGNFICGDNSGVLSFDLLVNGSNIGFPDNELVASDYYGISVVGNSTGVTNFDWTGGSIVSNGSRISFDASDTNVDKVDMVGVTITHGDTISFSSIADITNITLNDCLQADPSTGVFQNNKLTNSVATDGALLWPTSGNTSDCTFLNCDKGAEVAQTTEQTFSGMIFDDEVGNYDVNNTSDSEIDINLTNGSNANSYTGSVVNFLNSKSFAFTLLPSITGYEWRIYSVTAVGSLVGAVELDGEETATVDNQAYQYEYTSDTIIAVQILSGPYEESITYYTLKNTDQSVDINLTLDDND